MSSAAALIDKARQQTGLGDLGEDSFREGLGILVAALDSEARLNEMGRMSMDAQLTDMLAKRLEIEHWYRIHPEIDDEEIVAPLIGLGLPRTGSSALACLLGEDPAARSLRNWESQAPCPPPETATQDSDPRIAKAEASMERRARLFPRMTAMLPSTATSPTECQYNMGFDFKSQMFQAFAHIPTYTDWLNNRADLVPTYRLMKRIYKLLQWRCGPKRWRIKNPSHSLFITAIDEVFPDARFVMTHRDVASVLPSVSDLYFEMHRVHSDQVDMPAIGSSTREWCELAMRRMMAFRDAGNEHRFFDVQFAPFQKDPFAVLEDLYVFLGEELTGETRARMEHWRRTTPRDAGYQRTDPAEFGLDSTSLRRQFAFYSDRFNIPMAGA